MATAPAADDQPGLQDPRISLANKVDILAHGTVWKMSLIADDSLASRSQNCFSQCFLYKRAERSQKEKAKLQQEILDYMFENGMQAIMVVKSTTTASLIRIR